MNLEEGRNQGQEEVMDASCRKVNRQLSRLRPSCEPSRRLFMSLGVARRGGCWSDEENMRDGAGV